MGLFYLGIRWFCLKHKGRASLIVTAVLKMKAFPWALSSIKWSNRFDQLIILVV